MTEIRFTTEDDDGAEVVHTLPARWAICGTCRGEGKHSHAIGAITADEWASEWSADEQEGYLRGDYDRECETCGGTGKVREVDEDRADKATLALYEEQQQDAAAYRAEVEAERRAGC